MRTVDPERWYTRAKETQTRKLFGIQSMSALEKCLRTSFAKAMMDFWKNCSIGGVKCIREKNMPRAFRRCYVVLILLLMLLGLLSLCRSWAAYRSTPLLIVTPVSSQQHISQVDFPAVALCTNNVISKAALEQYASYLYSLDENGTYLLKDIERNLLTFGSLVTWSGPAVDASFMEYIARVAYETNVTNVIMKLTPQCSSFMHRCGWRTTRIPCERLFALRATPHGYCCVFNSRYQDEDLRNPVHRLQLVDQDSGLSVVIKLNDSDVAFIRGPEDGVEVLLFEGSDYPLIEGGSSRVYLTHRETSAYLKLSAKVQVLAPYLNYYNEEWRGCRMRHAHSRTVALRSHAWCIANCRRRTVQALCGCVPHLLFPQPDDTVCSPDQLVCLNKHKEKFFNFYPGEFADPSLNEESSDSMECDECAPDCTRLTYSATVSQADYQFTNKLFLNFFVSGLSLINTTVIRIFYATEEQKLFVVESNRRWYEVAAFLGSQWLCVVAVTSVSVLELVYHVTIRWGYHYVHKRKMDGRFKKQLATSVEQRRSI